MKEFLQQDDWLRFSVSFNPLSLRFVSHQKYVYTVKCFFTNLNSVSVWWLSAADCPFNEKYSIWWNCEETYFTFSVFLCEEKEKLSVCRVIDTDKLQSFQDLTGTDLCLDLTNFTRVMVISKSRNSSELMVMMKMMKMLSVCLQAAVSVPQRILSGNTREGKTLSEINCESVGWWWWWWW